MMMVNNIETIEYVTCNICGWVHMGVTRDYALESVRKFNEYFHKLTEEQREECYGNREANILTYERCMVCGNSYKDFRPSKVGDCPNGCTINPLIHFTEETRFSPLSNPGS